MYLEKPCVGTLLMFMLAGSMEVPEEIHACLSVFLPTAAICRGQCLLGLLSDWHHCLKETYNVSQLVICLQLFPSVSLALQVSFLFLDFFSDSDVIHSNI